MNALLDQDILERLGGAYRDARSDDVSEPLPEKLRALWERLGHVEGGAVEHFEPDARDADSRRAHA